MISKWLYIHIPKTGGTWFKNALGIGDADSPVRPSAYNSVYDHATKSADDTDNLATIEMIARMRAELRMKTGSPRELQPYDYVENLAHAFPYHFTVDGWMPKASKYSHMPSLKDKPYHRVFCPNYTEENDHMEYVTTIRNPFSLLYSYWRYEPKDQSDWTANTPQLGGWANCNVVMNLHSFSDFVEHYLDDDKTWHVPPLKENLFAQIYRKDGTLIPKPENILRCEHLKADTTQWCDRNSIPCRDVPLDKRNVNPVKDTHIGKYSRMQIARLEIKWEPILRRFGYHHGGIHEF